MENSLIDFGLLEYLEKAKDKTSLPGGGSICALNGALGASLAIMVLKLSEDDLGKSDIEEIESRLEHAYSFLVLNIDKDARSFDSVLQAMRLPKETKEEREFRENKVQEGYIYAIKTPLNTMRFSLDVLKDLLYLAEEANVYGLSDVKIATDLAYTSIRGASFTALMNLNSLKDESKKKSFLIEISTIEDQSRMLENKIEEIIKTRVE